MASDENEDEFLGYRLTISVRGSGVNDDVVLESLDPLELEPREVERCGIMYQQYPGEDEACVVEVRADYVVDRRIELVKKDDTNKTPRGDGDFGASDEGRLGARES
jgi:hypothetical protein